MKQRQIEDALTVLRSVCAPDTPLAFSKGKPFPGDNRPIWTISAGPVILCMMDADNAAGGRSP